MTTNTPRFLAYLGVALVTLFGLGYALMLGQCAIDRGTCLGNSFFMWQVAMNSEAQLASQAKYAVVGTLALDAVILGVYALFGRRKKEQKEDQPEPSESKGFLKNRADLAIMAVILVLSFVVWNIVNKVEIPQQGTKQTSLNNSLQKKEPKKTDEEIIASASNVDGVTYSESIRREKERMTKLIQRDPAWAVKVMLYMISPSPKALEKSAMIDAKNWEDQDLAELVLFKQAFIEQGYIQGSAGNRTFKQASSDETAQGLFEEAVRFQEDGKTNDMSFPIRLNKYAVSIMDEVKERGLLD